MPIQFPRSQHLRQFLRDGVKANGRVGVYIVLGKDRVRMIKPRFPALLPALKALPLRSALEEGEQGVLFLFVEDLVEEEGQQAHKLRGRWGGGGPSGIRFGWSSGLDPLFEMGTCFSIGRIPGSRAPLQLR